MVQVHLKAASLSKRKAQGGIERQGTSDAVLTFKHVEQHVVLFKCILCVIFILCACTFYRRRCAWVRACGLIR